MTKLTKLDVLAKSADFAERSTSVALSRWKWELLDLIDGTRSIGALANAARLDLELIAVFAEEAIANNLLRLVTLTRDDYYGTSFRPERLATARPLAAAEPVPTPPPAPQPLPVMAAIPPPLAHVPENVVRLPEPAALDSRRAEPAGPDAEAGGPMAQTLQDRVAALKARALKAMDKPRSEEYATIAPPAAAETFEFSLSATPKTEPARSADEIEFSL